MRLNTVAWFGDWSIGRIERYYPDIIDENGIVFKVLLIEPDEVTIYMHWRNYDNFYKEARNSKGEPSEHGNYIITRIPSIWFTESFKSGNSDIQFILCGMFGAETVFTRREEVLQTKILSRDSKIESLKVQVVLAHEQMKNLLTQRTDLSKIAIDHLKMYKAIGERNPYNDENVQDSNKDDYDNRN